MEKNRSIIAIAVCCLLLGVSVGYIIGDKTKTVEKIPDRYYMGTSMPSNDEPMLFLDINTGMVYLWYNNTWIEISDIHTFRKYQK